MNDILHDEFGDLLLINGDVVIGNSELQEVGKIIQANPGDIKSDPICGLGITKYIKAKSRPEFLEAELKVQLQRDDKNYIQIKKKIKINRTFS